MMLSKDDTLKNLLTHLELERTEASQHVGDEFFIGHSPPAGCGAGSAPVLPAPRNVIFGMVGFPWALSAAALRVSRPLGLTLSILPTRILGLLKATCRLQRFASLPESVHQERVSDVPNAF